MKPRFSQICGAANQAAASYSVKGLIALLVVVLLSGCGGGGGSSFSGNTNVTLFMTGSANDVFTVFAVGINQLTLTDRNGKTVNLLTAPGGPESIHLNGVLEPWTTVSIPQGVYTSASITPAGAGYLCAGLDPSANWIDLADAYIPQLPADSAVVKLASPITVTGENMGLVLDLLVNQSVTFTPPCWKVGGAGIITFSPLFALDPLSNSGQNIGTENVSGLQGVVASVASSGSFTVAAMEYITWQVTTNAGTSFQGITSSPQIAVGMPVEFDGTVQPDGSLAATRVEAYDTDSSTPTVIIGPLLTTNQSGGDPDTKGHVLYVSKGLSQSNVKGLGNFPMWDYSSATFQISGRLSNLKNLPFTPSFSAVTMVTGQEVAVASNVSSFPHQDSYGNPEPAAATVTLVPQTINGTVTGIANEGSFTTYTVTLANYDLFPDLAAEPGPVSTLQSPSTVVVYADSSTQQLNTNPIAVGSVVRFYGLVFNDNGTLRMDCAQINDGVPE